MLMGAGDPQAGYRVVIRQTSTCTLCHAGPFPNPHLQGDIGPDLHGIGARLSAAEIRARLVNAKAMNPETVMPSFGAVGGTRVGKAWTGKPILSAQEIEDAVAYLESLK
ncbi:MAG: sulfur oxidation c-type cytochrome SoxX [Janthinobacterium lividum]